MPKVIVENLQKTQQDIDSVNDVLQNYSFEQQQEMLAELEGYTSVPVSIQQFVEDTYYIGNMWGGVHEDGPYEGQPKVFPYWMAHLKDIYPNPFTSPYEEVCITGAIGIGKTTVAIIGLLYDMYRLLITKNPHSKFNLGENKIIATALFTATKNLGNVVLYNGLMDTINTSPFFKKLYYRKQYQPNVIFPHNIGIINGSQFKDALGTDIIQGVIDEANFQNVRLNQVIDNYSNIKQRIISRYMGPGGNLPCRLWILSSKTDNDSFLELHINKSRNNAKVKVIEAALWEAHGHLTEKYCGRRFRVFCGDTNKEPQILPEGQPVPQTIDVSKVIDVPVEYYDAFEMNLLDALRNIAGKTTASKFKLFRSREQINKVLILPPAFVKDVIMLEEYDDKDQIADYLSSDFWQTGMKDAPHFLHMDTALTTDRFGIALCHVHGRKEVKRVDNITGKTSVFQEMIIMHDFCLGLQAKPGQEIPFDKVLNFIVWLREIGFNMGSLNSEFLSRTGKTTSYDHRKGGGLITVDGYQSRETQHRLRKQGFEVHELSVDKTKDPYIAYKRAVMEDRVYSPRNEQLAKELLDVEDTGSKIDHTIKGSKDLADAVVGSFYSCLENAHSSHLYSDVLLNQMRDVLDDGRYIWNSKFGQFV